jgi:hypothetical protein
MVHLARQFADLLGQASQVGQRMEISFLELRDPEIYTLLGVSQ